MDVDKMESKVVQITNICPNINVEQIKTFLGFIGRVEQLRLYPERMHFMAGGNNITKVCYAKFAKMEDASVALHLTNTVFIDRALIVVPVETGVIPDETEGMKNAMQTGGYSGYLSTNSTNGDLFGQLCGPSSLGTDEDGYDELSRTVYIENIPPDVVSKPEMLLDFCSQIGEVKYARLAGDPPIDSAFVEFSSQSSAQAALQHDGSIFCGQPIRIGLSNTLIHKPQLKSNSDAQKEIEVAMEQVRRAESLITAHASSGNSGDVPLPGSINKSVFRTRTRSRSREPSRVSKRTRSPSPPIKREARKRDAEREISRRKSRTRSPKERKRSKSKSPEKPKDRRRTRSRERSLENRRKAREKSREARERSREAKEKERERKREEERLEREKEKEREREEREKERERREKERIKEKSRKAKDRDRSPEEERSSHKKKHKKEKKRRHKDVSRSRSPSREKGARNSGSDGKSKTSRNKSQDSSGDEALES